MTNHVVVKSFRCPGEVASDEDNKVRTRFLQMLQDFIDMETHIAMNPDCNDQDEHSKHQNELDEEMSKLLLDCISNERPDTWEFIHRRAHACFKFNIREKNSWKMKN